MDSRKLSYFFLLLASSFLLSACEEPTEDFVIPSRPVKTIVVGGGATGDTRTFPAEVDAIQKANISFRVSGKIQKVHVKEGDGVKKGQVLAELDPTDFKITLKDRKASFATAKANFERAVDLVEKGAISKVEHDNLRATFQTAKANLASAEQDLIYTKLKANFDGHIAKRYVENFEEVILSKKIFALEDVSSLKIIFDVPENIMIAIDRTKDNKRKLFVTFDTIKDKQFPLKFREAATKADPSTKTFKITMQMVSSDKYNILPGMTGTVIAQMYPNETSSDASTTLPVSAVIANNKKQATVWIVDEKTMTVKPKAVTPGLMTGNNMQIAGLNPGERVVVAGAAFLRENMKVTLLETGEQPE